LLKETETITDIDGNIYHTVKIGTQVWMAENLNVSHFRNGEIIPEARTNEEWEEAGKNKQPAWCYYDNNPENGEIYGKLYNWYAVNDKRRLALKDWHVPADNDWMKLTNYLGGETEAGKKIKKKKNVVLNETTKTTNDNCGFNALSGGSRFNGKFDGIDIYANWWASPENNPLNARTYCLAHLEEQKELQSNNYLLVKEGGYSVRCIKDVRIYISIEQAKAIFGED